MDRLLREGNPPAGQLASPKPQYKDVQTNNWEELKGEDGASYVKDKAVLAKLADLESELATIKANQLSGDQKVRLSGTIMELSKQDRRIFRKNGHYIATTTATNPVNLYYGQTTGVDAPRFQPFDIRGLEGVAVLIYNGTDKEATVWAVGQVSRLGSNAGENLQVGRILKRHDIPSQHRVKIAPGGYTALDILDLLDLARVDANYFYGFAEGLYLGISVAGGSSTGELMVHWYGDGERWVDTQGEKDGDLRGLHANRPDPSTVVGKTYWSIDTGEIAVSTGSIWKFVGVI